MWTNNTRNAKINGGSNISVLRYWMVMKILIIIFFFEIKESKITRGHNYSLVKKKVDWTL